MKTRELHLVRHHESQLADSAPRRKHGGKGSSAWAGLPGAGLLPGGCDARSSARFPHHAAR